MRLRHEIQNLIDRGTITPPTGNAPNVNTNPLPNHRAVPPRANINFVEYTGEEVDPTMCIVPITQSAPTVVPPGLPTQTIEEDLTRENSSVGLEGLEE